MKEDERKKPTIRRKKRKKRGSKAEKRRTDIKDIIFGALFSSSRSFFLSLSFRFF